MPYIKSNDGRRESLQKREPALNAGELNYQIFYFIKHNSAIAENCKYGHVKTFVDNFLGENPNYQRYNDMTGALIRCGKELERRLNINAIFLQDIMNSYDNEIAKYEDKKIIENFDVE